jgi:hypothetical protein
MPALHIRVLGRFSIELGAADQPRNSLGDIWQLGWVADINVGIETITLAPLDALLPFHTNALAP